MGAYKKYYIFIVFLFIQQLAFPQIKKIGTPYIRNYKISEIDAGAQTWMIDISTEGLAYFANNDGVLEFDGRTWRRFPLPDGIVVRCVLAANNGRIYAGGFNQMGYFHPDEKGKMIFHSLMELLPDSYRDFGEVWRIYELPYGIVFQSYEQLMILNKGKFDIIKAPGIFHFSFKVNNELYINDQANGLYRLAHDRLVHIPAVAPLKGQLVYSILPKGNNLLIATEESGIYEFDGLHLKAWNAGEQDFFRQSQIYCGSVIKDNVYAFGSVQDGLLLCDSSGKVIQQINEARGLQNNTVLSIKLDQYGNLWSGLDNGIDYVEISSPLSYFTNYHNLSAGYSAILYDSLLYFGTNRGVFYTNWDELRNNSAKARFKIVQGTQGQVWDLEIIDSTLFCGHNSGVFSISGTTSTKMSEVQGGWTFIRPDERDDILICGTYTSLLRFEKENGRWQEGRKIKGFDESSRFLAKAGKNMIWMTHGYLGVFRLHFNAAYDSVIKVEVYKEQQGLPSAKNNSVYEILDQAVFTTVNGLYEYDSRTNSFVPNEQLQEIFTEDNITKLLEDEEGNIWYFTEDGAGVYRLNEDGSYLDVDIPFRELQGRFINWFQFVYPLDAENVFFGIQDGFVHYAPDFPKNYNRELRVFIRSIELPVADSVIYSGGYTGDSILEPLPYKYNQLRFEFTANEFENPDNVQFSTFIDGFDESWSAWQNKASRDVPGLPHGEYLFHVKAKNIFGTESNISTVKFEIESPWFLTWWAYTMYLLVIAALASIIAFYVRYRINKSKKEEENRQKKLFSEREKQLKTETLEAEKEVIKLRNEKLASDMRQKDKELANNTMQMIQKSKSLTSIKKELNLLAKNTNDENTREILNRMIRKINREIDTENQWEVFEKHFASVHEEFLKHLKTRYPDLTPRELKLCAYLRLNISSKEIATLMNISTRGVEISRYRIRKKLNLDRDTNLTSFIMSL